MSLPPSPGKPARSGGIASDVSAARAAGMAVGGSHGAPRPGEGVADPDELRALIALLRQQEAGQADANRRAIQIGEFTVDGLRVPLTFAGALQQLSRTEAAVLRFLGWGRANADIAVLLGMTENTVRTHLNNAVKKLDVDGMRELNSVAGLLFHPID